MRTLCLSSGVLMGAMVMLGLWSGDAQGAQTPGVAGEVYVGAGAVEITPPRPVALAGQFHTRISRGVETPLWATALALETRQGDQGRQSLEQAIFLSLDLVAIRNGLTERVRQKLDGKLAGFDQRKLILSATHTHTAPVTIGDGDAYQIPDDGAMKPAEYVDFLVDRLAEVATKAWESRKKGGVSWTLGQAVVGHNRRAVYADGSAQMYGSTTKPSFRGIEGTEDPSVHLLFAWNGDKQLLGLAINLACTAQEVENRNFVNADFWHEVRERLAKQTTGAAPILGWCSAAGDQSPHLLWQKKAEERMQKLRGLTPMQEIGRRIAGAVDDTMEVAKKDIRPNAVFVHRVQEITLPPRKISEAEYKKAKAATEKWAAIQNPTAVQRLHLKREKTVMDRYEKGEQVPAYTMELHAIRLGDIAIATNPFELFIDYGIQIKARSPATQTFLIQLSGDSGKYLPTAKAVSGGSYSATPECTTVGPEGGQVLVDKTVEALEQLWK